MLSVRNLMGMGDPMEMRDRIAAALKDAMKSRDADRLSTLRLINAAIKDRDIALRGEGGDATVGDAEVLTILGRMVKQRQESARAYEEGGRLELAERELAEVKVIEKGKRLVPEEPAEEIRRRVLRQLERLRE